MVTVVPRPTDSECVHREKFVVGESGWSALWGQRSRLIDVHRLEVRHRWMMGHSGGRRVLDTR